jgi:hypothetical protein
MLKALPIAAVDSLCFRTQPTGMLQPVTATSLDETGTRKMHLFHPESPSLSLLFIL